MIIYKVLFIIVIATAGEQSQNNVLNEIVSSLYSFHHCANLTMVCFPGSFIMINLSNLIGF